MIRSHPSCHPLLPEEKKISGPDSSESNTAKVDGSSFAGGLRKADEGEHLLSPTGDGSILFELYKRRTTAVVARETFLNVVCDALAEYKYVGHKQRADLDLACR